MRALRGLPLLLLVVACSTPVARDVALTRTSASSVVIARVESPTSAVASATADPLTAVEPARAKSPQPGPCDLPRERPSSFGVKMVQHVMPQKRPDFWVGGELATKTNVCPRDAGALVVAPCTIVSEPEMDEVYEALTAGKLCSLRHHTPPQRASPHYGSRSITVYIGERSFEVSDSSGDLLDAASNKRFYEMTAVINERAAAKP